MNREEVFAKLQLIFRDIFDDESIVIEESSNASTIEEWDSLNHINLIVVIEKEFNIKFSLAELSGLKNVGSMVDLMMVKMK